MGGCSGKPTAKPIIRMKTCHGVGHTLNEKFPEHLSDWALLWSWYGGQRSTGRGGEKDKLKTFMLFFLLPQEETPPSEDRCLI